MPSGDDPNNKDGVGQQGQEQGQQPVAQPAPQQLQPAQQQGIPQQQPPLQQGTQPEQQNVQNSIQNTNATRSGANKDPSASKNAGANKQGAGKDDGKSEGKKGKDQGDDRAGDAKKKFPKPLVIIPVLLALIALITFQYLRNRPEGKSGYLRINGRIEGYEVNVGAKIAGRVEWISNREGDEVKYLQPLVKLSDEDIRAQLDGAKARWAEAQESVKEAQAQLNVSKEGVNQAKLNVTQSREDAAGRIEQASANVASTQAQLSQAESQEVQAKADLNLAAVRIKRYDELVVKGAVTQDEDDQAHSTYESNKATVGARHSAVIAAQKQILAAQAALMQAKSNALNPPIRLSQEASSNRTVAQSEAALARAMHDVKNAESSIREIESNIAYLNINSPIRGIVTARTVEPGAVVAAGQTVISLINLDTVFLRAYVPDSEIGKVRLYQKAFVYYDSNPKHGVSGKVIEIDPQASFTPENIYFRDDRVKQVFGIKILIDNPSNYAKPGMPADADLDIRAHSGEKNT